MHQHSNRKKATFDSVHRKRPVTSEYRVDLRHGNRASGIIKDNPECRAGVPLPELSHNRKTLFIFSAFIAIALLTINVLVVRASLTLSPTSITTDGAFNVTANGTSTFDFGSSTFQLNTTNNGPFTLGNKFTTVAGIVSSTEIRTPSSTIANLTFTNASGTNGTLSGYLAAGTTGSFGSSLSIGTTTQSGALNIVVNSGQTQVAINNNQTTRQDSRIFFEQGGTILWQVGTDINADNTNNFFIQNQGVSGPSIAINSTGNVGISTSSPTSKLYVSGLAGQNVDPFIVASSSGKIWLDVKVGGNIGIGTSTPATQLQLYGASSTLRIGDSGVTGCLELGNSDGTAGINYVTALNGVLSATTTKPTACQ